MGSSLTMMKCTVLLVLFGKATEPLKICRACLAGLVVALRVTHGFARLCPVSFLLWASSELFLTFF